MRGNLYNTNGPPISIVIQVPGGPFVLGDLTGQPDMDFGQLSGQRNAAKGAISFEKPLCEHF